MSKPVICLGQQPSGFFPKRFLVAKMLTARRLQKELGAGAEIVFFYHDADHDPRETKTTLRTRKFGDAGHFNFDFENKVQRKFSPLYLKRILKEWHTKTSKQLAEYLPPKLLEMFRETPPTTVGEFCLEMHRKMGLLDGIRVVRSGDPAVRCAACDIADYYADVPYEGEIVRARLMDGQLKLHEGGSSFITVPTPEGGVQKDQISPTRDTRLKWMQSVIHCTHYITGAGEQAYLKKDEAPEIQFVMRDPIERQDEAWVEVS